MDALRKAEEEKRKAEAQEAERAATLGPDTVMPRPAAPDELSLEPLADSTPAPTPFGVPIEPGHLQFDLTEAPEPRPEAKVRRSARELRAGEITSPTVQIGSFVTAQTVFGTQRTSVPRRMLLQWSIAAAVVLAAVLGGAGFYYYQLTPRTQELPSPAAAQAARAAQDEVSPAPVAQAPQTNTGAESTAPEHTTGMVVTRPEAEPVTRTAVPPAGETLAAAKAPLSEPAATKPPEPAPRPRAETTASSAGGDVLPGEVRITHRRAVPAISQAVASAYAALQAREIERAESLYRSVLAEHPDHRDALLGLAAIAVETGRLEEALGLYRAVLERDPRDAAAAAALLSLDPGGNAPVNEVDLKRLIDEDPGAAYLHFALGTRYASAGRWSDAQQAFFEAYRRDDANADYAYNLAVSLDRMGQGPAALDYYRRALLLLDAGGAHFNDATVLERIAALADTIE
jgi:Tfp pilus assembly protein PilF